MGKLGMHTETDGLACSWRIVNVVAHEYEWAGHTGGGDQSEGPVPWSRHAVKKKERKEKRKMKREERHSLVVVCAICPCILYCDYY